MNTCNYAGKKKRERSPNFGRKAALEEGHRDPERGREDRSRLTTRYGITKFRPLTPTLRFQQLPAFEEITKSKPHKALTEVKKRSGGRNNNGRLTSRHIGGGHKQKYRKVDFKRRKHGVAAEVVGDRVRSESLGAHRVDQVCGRRDELHPRARWPNDWRQSDVRRQRAAGARKLAALERNSARLQHSQHRDRSRSRRPDCAQRGSAGDFEQPRSRLCAGEIAFGRNSPHPRNLLRHDGPGRQRRSHERGQRQSRSHHVGRASARPCAAWS